MKHLSSRFAAVMPALLALILYSSPGRAVLTLDWWNVGSGGVTRSDSGQLTLGGTAGQTDAGLLMGDGTLVLRGGFWRGVSPTVSVPEEIREVIPDVFRMHAAVPNPFNPNTLLAFDMPEAVPCRLEIFDPAGHLVVTLVDGRREAGRHRISWTGRDQAGNAVGSGVYLVRLRAGEYRDTQKIVLLK